MTHLITSTVSSKSQLTLPKEVRAVLGVKSKGDLVGFLVDTESGSVQLSRVEPVLVDAEFTADEFRKLLKLRGDRKGKGFKSMLTLLKDLKS